VAVTITCTVCGKLRTMPAAWARKVKTPSCSRQCNGKLRGAEWAKHGHKGATARKTFTPLLGEKNPAWKGGVTHRHRHGNYVQVRYVRAPEWAKPMARKDGYVMEHRLTMAQWCGYLLTRTEAVHHIDHDPLRNERANLELWPDNRSHKLAEHGRFVEGAVCRYCPGG
jgi:hypothetical protein